MSTMDLNEIIISACENNSTMSLAAKEVGIPYSTFKRKAIQLNVWNPNQGAKGTHKYVKNLQDVFDGKSKMRTYNIKNRLIAEGIKDAICESCGIGENWNGKDLVLELDHIDGNNTNNSLENLRILCPNCHAMTDNYRGKNVKTKKSEPSIEWLNNLTNAELIKLPPKEKEIKQCLTCNGEYTGKSKKYCSIECYYEGKRINNTIPKVPELLEIFGKHKTFTSVGRHYNVSDNAVRKWCKNYGIMEMIQNTKH